jgi:flagellar protein FliO/FliZ
MKRFSTFILILLSFMLVAGVAMSGARSELYAQERKKTSAKHDASAPRKVVDFTDKKKSKEKVQKEQKVEADAPKEASGDGEKAADQETAPAPAADAPLYTYEHPEEDETSYGWMIVKTILVLGIFGAGFYFFFKYITKRGMIPNVGRSVVQTIAITPVGQNKTIQVVEIAGRILIVGVTDHQISLISEITSKDEIDRIRLQSSKSTPVENTSFQEFVAEHVDSLISFIGKIRSHNEQKKKKRHLNSDDIYENERVDYMREQRDRLKRMNGYDNDKER